MNVPGDPSPTTSTEESVPPPWSLEITGTGETQLTCGAQTGPGKNLLIGVGMVFCALGVLGIVWLLMGNLPRTVEGYLTYLMPAGVVLCGFLCFDAALFTRSRYLIGDNTFTAQKISLFQRKRLVIPRESLVAVWQQYSPPDPRAPSSTPGDWVTHLVYNGEKEQDMGVFPLDGEHSEAEAVWLATFLHHWAGVAIERSFAPSVNEAKAGPLPELPPLKNGSAPERSIF